LTRSTVLRGAAPLLILLLVAASAPAQTLVSHYETTSFGSGLPEDTGASWARVGTGHVLLLSEGEMLLNDNSPGMVVAYQGLLGQVEAGHDVVFRGEVKVLSNIGGEGALIEVSRPGMEVLVELYPDAINVLERSGRDPARWLGSVSVDLGEFRTIEVHKTSDASSLPERVMVSVDGVEVISVEPRGTGDLGLGRILFGSLGYPDLGATVWRWVEVRAEPEEQKTPATAATIGRLKGRFQE
jgi:hypothetical protein